MFLLFMLFGGGWGLAAHSVAIIDGGPSNLAHVNYNWADDSGIDYKGHAATTMAIYDTRRPKHIIDRLYLHRVVNGKGHIKVSSVIDAIKQSIKDGVDVISISVGTHSFTNDELNTLLYEAVFHHDIVVVASAGNDGPSRGSINAPAHLPYVIAVGGCDDKHSSRGPSRWKHTWFQKPDIRTPFEASLTIDNASVIRSGTSVSVHLFTAALVHRTWATGIDAYKNWSSAVYNDTYKMNPHDKPVLFDIYHSYSYWDHPSDTFERDHARGKSSDDDMGDHPYTNYYGLREHMRMKGYRLVPWNDTLDKIDIEQYHGLMIIDNEYPLADRERGWFHTTMKTEFPLIIVPDWSDHRDVHGWNNVLIRYNIEIGSKTCSGEVLHSQARTWTYDMGNPLAKVPNGSRVLTAKLHGHKRTRAWLTTLRDEDKYVIGMTYNNLMVYTDSSCFDDSNDNNKCWWLASSFLNDPSSVFKQRIKDTRPSKVDL